MQKPQRGVEQLAEFGRRVRRAREATGMSQEQLGEAAGLHRTYIGHVERGEVNTALLNVLKIAAALGIDASTLVTGIAKSLGDPRVV